MGDNRIQAEDVEEVRGIVNSLENPEDPLGDLFWGLVGKQLLPNCPRAGLIGVGANELIFSQK